MDRGTGRAHLLRNKGEQGGKGAIESLSSNTAGARGMLVAQTGSRQEEKRLRAQRWAFLEHMLAEEDDDSDDTLDRGPMQALRVVQERKQTRLPASGRGLHRCS